MTQPPPARASLLATQGSRLGRVLRARSACGGPPVHRLTDATLTAWRLCTQNSVRLACTHAADPTLHALPPDTAPLINPSKQTPLINPLKQTPDKTAHRRGCGPRTCSAMFQALKSSLFIPNPLLCTITTSCPCVSTSCVLPSSEHCVVCLIYVLVRRGNTPYWKGREGSAGSLQGDVHSGAWKAGGRWFKGMCKTEALEGGLHSSGFARNGVGEETDRVLDRGTGSGMYSAPLLKLSRLRKGSMECCRHMFKEAEQRGT